MTTDSSGKGRWVLRFSIRWTVRSVVVAFAVLITLILVQAFLARQMMPIQLWHHTPIASEFTEAHYTDSLTFADWMTRENRVFEELSGYRLEPAHLNGHTPLSRYVRGGRQDPARQKPDWNRTQEIAADNPKGGVLLLHGLSDSPYSMRSFAELFAAEGFHVVVQRMPGHGTVPAGLLEATWQDWAAAVKVGARRVAERIGPHKPFYLAGYSNGGALSVNHCLDAIEGGAFRVPDRLFLFSPAIGITAFARLARWDAMYGFIPYFEQSRWLSLQPEIDPYKYNSFPKNAGSQSWELARIIQEKLDRLKSAGHIGKLPPMLAFQSAVDATVVADTLITGLFDYFEHNGSELVLFDVNHAAGLDSLVTHAHQDRLRALLLNPSLGFTRTVISNADSGSPHSVEARSLEPGNSEAEVTRLGLSWPDEVFSLAHIAVPFPPEDPLYGATPAKGANALLPIGQLALRGERGVLRVPASQLLRQHYNPFHSWVCEKILAATRTDLQEPKSSPPRRRQ